MKDSNDVDKGGGVRKYRYISPSKKETLPQQWAQDLEKSETITSSKKLISGINLDSVWSIKKNVSVDSKANKQSGENYSSGLAKSTHEQFNSTKPFYSRHKSSPGSIVSSESSTKTADSLVNRYQRPWHNAHISTNKNDILGSRKNSVIDEFDFDFPSSNSTQWNENNTRKSPKNRKSSSTFAYSEETDDGNSNTSPISGLQSKNDSNYSSKYNYYFNF